MKDGIFKSEAGLAFARAPEVMSTQSETDFEWSVKIIDDWSSNGRIVVGIGSQFKREESLIRKFISLDDQNAILYNTMINYSSHISIGCIVTVEHQNLPERKPGDVIRCRFKPRRKKFVIHLVRILKIAIDVILTLLFSPHLIKNTKLI